MILFDPNAKAVSNVGTKKLEKKGSGATGAKFSASKNVSSTQSAPDAAEVADIAPLLFLQEVDEFQQEQQELEDFAEKAFKGLKELQLAVLSGKLSEQHLLNLQTALQRNCKFAAPELKALAEEIEIRIAVEIAKIEQARYQK